MNDKLPTLCLDFDGVLHTYDKGWHDGTVYGDLMDGAEDFLEKMLDKYNVIVSSARYAPDVYNWLTEKLPYIDFQLTEDKFWYSPGSIGVTNTKPVAVAYVDDRAIPFVNFELVSEMLEEMENI